MLGLGGLLFLFPLTPVHAAVISNGGPVLGVVHQTGGDAAPTVTFANAGCNSISQPGGCSPSELFVNATAGNIGAHIGFTGCPSACTGGDTGNLTIFFDVGATPLITVGAEFWLYLSTNGVSGAGLTPGDVKYAGPFLGTLLTQTLKGYTKGFGNVPQTNGTYYIGKTPGTTCLGTYCEIVEGPLPIAIPAGFQFIKIYDGTTVAAFQYLTISPGIRLTPTSGPAGTPTTVWWGGFKTAVTFDLNYSFTFYYWNKPTGAGHVVKAGQWETGISSTSAGYGSAVFPMLDTKQSVNNKTSATNINDVITITAVTHVYKHKLIANNPAIDATAAVFTEKSRTFNQAISFDQNNALVFNDTALASPGYYGNDSGFAPIIGEAASISGGIEGTNCPANNTPAFDCENQPLPVFATGHLWLTGTYWCFNGTVSFWVSNSTSSTPAASSFNPFAPGTFTATGSKAKFGLNLTVPTNLVQGLHVVKVSCDNVYYTFTIYMEPTLVLTPNSGTASNPRTLVNVSAYGFPGHTTTFLYWNEIVFGDNTEYNLLNATTNGHGQFEGQPNNASLSFWVPETYGGPHNFTAFTSECGFQGATFNNHNDGFGPGPFSFFLDYYAECGIAQTQFTVLASFVVIPSSFNASYGKQVKAVAEGLIPGVWYSVNIDNQMADFATTFVAFPSSFLTGGVTTSTSVSSGTTITITVSSSTVISCVRTTGVVCHHKDPLADPAGPLFADLHGLVTPNGQGEMNLTFIGAGFRPGLHVITLNDIYGESMGLPVNQGGSNGNSYPADTALFTVTTAGDPIAAMLVSIQTSLTGITTSLTNIQTSLTNIQSSVSSLSGAVSALQTSVNTLTTNVASLQTSVNGLGTQISGVQSSLSSSLSSLSSKVDSLSSSVSNLQSSVTTLGGKVDTISTNVGGLGGLTSTANSILSAVQTEQTYVLVVAALAAITLVLALAILVRKLS